MISEPEGSESKWDMDATRVKVEIKEGGQGSSFCQKGEWVLTNYKGFSGDQEVIDSKSDNNDKPKVFRLGTYQVSKCWEIAMR